MDRTNRNTALASALVEELARCGVREAAVCPGSRSSPLALALLREPSIRMISVVDERSAGFYALGAGLARGVPAVVLCTSGTAAANLHPAVCEANESGVPMIVLTADRPPELRGIGAGQTIDQLKLYGSAVRWFCEVGTHDADDSGLLHHRSVACRAYALAAGDPRPGPVHLNLSWRDPLGPEPRPRDVTAVSALALRGRGNEPLTEVVAAPGKPSEEEIDRLAALVEHCAGGVIVAGRMRDARAREAITALARVCGFPILAEPTSQLRLGPHDRDLVVDTYGAIATWATGAASGSSPGDDYIPPVPLAPDLILRFGEMPTSKALRSWLTFLHPRQVVFAPRFGWNEPTRAADLIVRAQGGLENVASGLQQRLGQAVATPRWLEHWQAADAAARTAIAAALEREQAPTEPGLHAALGPLYADGDLVYTASSMPIRDQESFLPPSDTDVRFLANRGANGIDGLVSSGIGAAIASGSPAWVITGDLGLFHDMNALALIRNCELPVRIVVPNNDGGGIFEFLPQAGQVRRAEFEAIFGTPLGLELEKVAALHGLAYERVEDLSNLAAVTDSTALIEVPVDRRGNVAAHKRLGEAAAAAIGRALG